MTLATTPVLALTGELTIRSAAGQLATVLAALSRAVDAAQLDLDLSGVIELDTAGLQILLLARREAVRLGIFIRIVRASEPVLEVLRLVRRGADLDDGTELDTEPADPPSAERTSG